MAARLHGSRRTTPLPAGWSRTRKRILHRDRRICYLCGEPGATEVDHVIPASRGGDDSDLNLAAAHATCHAKKTSRQARGEPRRRTPEAHPGRAPLSSTSTTLAGAHDRARWGAPRPSRNLQAAAIAGPTLYGLPRNASQAENFEATHAGLIPTGAGGARGAR